ncbi:MAG: hypothetical protein FRX49_01659 [Trebouxia sp. A1-2]|nr:MAG: hypothetical protein FRX49_01659 [Trebouxia sp. A1-2]
MSTTGIRATGNSPQMAHPCCWLHRFYFFIIRRSLGSRLGAKGGTGTPSRPGYSPLEAGGKSSHYLHSCQRKAGRSPPVTMEQPTASGERPALNEGSSLEHAITIRITVAPLLAPLLDAAAGAFPWAAAAALIEGRLLPTGCWLFQFDRQASAVLALVSGHWEKPVLSRPYNASTELPPQQHRWQRLCFSPFLGSLASELSRYLQLLGMAWGDFACAIFLLGASFYAVIALIPAKLLQEVRKDKKMLGIVKSSTSGRQNAANRARDAEKAPFLIGEMSSVDLTVPFWRGLTMVFDISIERELQLQWC